MLKTKGTIMNLILFIICFNLIWHFTLSCFVNCSTTVNHAFKRRRAGFGPQQIDNNGNLSNSQPNNLTRCSTTALNLRKESLTHNWEIKGFISYYEFMKRSEQTFDIKTEEVSFKSDIVDGKWLFKLSKIGNPEDVSVSATYTYEAKQPKKIIYFIKPALSFKSGEMELLSQKSSRPVVVQQRLYNRRGYSSYFEYVHTFTWQDLGKTFDNVTEKSEENEFEGQDEDVIGLRFEILAYFLTDPASIVAEDCPQFQNSRTVDSIMKKDEGYKEFYDGRQLIPPYIKHSQSMLHDEKFTDVTIKLGEQEFQAHRIILATSSPVFSSLLLDKSVEAEGFEEGSREQDLSKQSDSTILLPQNPLSEIVLEDDESFTGDVLQEILKYIYTGQADLEGRVTKLLLAAHKYELPDLKRVCEGNILRDMNTTNAVDMYDIGHRVSSDKIIQRAFSIMKGNKSRFVANSNEFHRLATKHPSLMFQLFVS